MRARFGRFITVTIIIDPQSVDHQYVRWYIVSYANYRLLPVLTQVKLRLFGAACMFSHCRRQRFRNARAIFTRPREPTVRGHSYDFTRRAH